MIPLNTTEKDIQLGNSTDVTENVSDYSYYYNEQSNTYFIIYNVIRCIQVIITIIANVMTLMVLRKLKYLTNGHILMVYLAIFNIIVPCSYTLEGFFDITSQYHIKVKHWDTICIVREFISITLIACNRITYIMLAVDR